MENFSHMIMMITHPKLLLNDMLYRWMGPNFGDQSTSSLITIQNLLRSLRLSLLQNPRAPLMRSLIRTFYLILIILIQLTVDTFKPYIQNLSNLLRPLMIQIQKHASHPFPDSKFIFLFTFGKQIFQLICIYSCLISLIDHHVYFLRREFLFKGVSMPMFLNNTMF